MENKTLQDFKDEVAKEQGYCDYTDVITYFEIAQESISNEAAERYASHVAEQACRKQREESQKRIFFIDEVEDMLLKLNNKKITIGKFVEVLNEKATGVDWLGMVKKEQDSRCKKHKITMDILNGKLVCPMCM